MEFCNDCLVTRCFLAHLLRSPVLDVPINNAYLTDSSSAEMKLAIVGGGASSFYVASRLLSRLPKDRPTSIHVFDRLWAPHGLVRYGVAPDHPEVKVGYILAS